MDLDGAFVKQFIARPGQAMMQLSTLEHAVSPGSGFTTQLAELCNHLSRGFSELSGPEFSWNCTTFAALVGLGLLWGLLVYSSWATWGNLTIDCGREMYVPAVLSEGKMLYRDVWYLYGPAGPYFNSFLFRVFGVHLNVLYWAGSLSALGSALFLYLAGMRLSSCVVGWTAGAVVLLQSFQPSLFSFPLPYSFSSVYGCLCACLFVWLIIGASGSKGWRWVLGAGTAAAIALLLKPEFGVACYATLILLVAARAFRERSWRRVLSDSLAILPGAVLCGLVIKWMVSIAGVDFITQENLASWPTSFFMRKYGQFWLDVTGFGLNREAFAGAMIRTTVFAAVVVAFYAILREGRLEGRSLFLRAGLAVTGLAFLISFLPANAKTVFCWVFFPQDMVLYVAIAALIAWWYFLRQPLADRRLQVALLFSFSCLLAFRILFGTRPEGYPIYYDGPVVLAFLLTLPRLIIPWQRSSRHFVVQQAEILVCCACLMAVVLLASPFVTRPSVPLTTERGTIRLSEHMAENYRVAIAFMKGQASKGERVLSVPEDTSLYFLSATHCPTRLFALAPGVLAPGKMTDEFIQELERGPTRYLIWSNRDFPQYHYPLFDADPARVVCEQYLRSHYRPLRPLLNNGPGWNAVIWERKAEGQ
jgi:hypothetical protein